MTAFSSGQRFNDYLNGLRDEFGSLSDPSSTSSRRFNICLGGLKGEFELMALEVECLRKERDEYKAKVEAQAKEFHESQISTKSLDKLSTSDTPQPANLARETTDHRSTDLISVNEIPRSGTTPQSYPDSSFEECGWSITFNNEVARELNVEMVHELSHEKNIWYVKFSEDGKFLATGCGDGNAYIYDVASGTLTRVLSTFKKDTSITAVCFSCDGTYLATGWSDGNIYIWDIHTKFVRNAFKGHVNTILSFCFSPNGRHLVSASHDSAVRLWSMRGGPAKLLTDDTPTFIDNPYYSCATFSPDGRYVATSHRDGIVRIWDIRKDHLTRRIMAHAQSAEDVAFMPDGNGLLSVGWTLRHWDVRTLAATEFCGISQPLDNPHREEEECLPEREYFGHTGYIRCLSISMDGRWVASCADDETIRIWDTRTTATQCILNEDDSIWTIDLSPTGNYLASGQHTGTVRIWRYSYRRG